jgi:hypothetical protein
VGIIVADVGVDMDIEGEQPWHSPHTTDTLMAFIILLNIF